MHAYGTVIFVRFSDYGARTLALHRARYPIPRGTSCTGLHIAHVTISHPIGSDRSMHDLTSCFIAGLTKVSPVALCFLVSGSVWMLWSISLYVCLQWSSMDLCICFSFSVRLSLYLHASAFWLLIYVYIALSLLPVCVCLYLSLCRCACPSLYLCVSICVCLSGHGR